MTLHECDSGAVTKFLERFLEDQSPGLFRVQVVHCQDAAHLTQGDKHLYFVQRLPAGEVSRPFS